MIESGTVKQITGWTFVSGDKPIRVCLCYIVFYYISIHTKIYSLKSYVINFYTPMSSNQSESRSMFFFLHARKMIRPMKRHSDARVSFQVSRLCMGLQHVLQYRKTFSALCV